MSKRIRIFDTTLRDGEQMPGVNFGICDKLNIALALEAAGVDIIEAGFPAASADEYTAVTRISENINEAAELRPHRSIYCAIQCILSTG